VRYLTIVRHAEAQNQRAGLDDFDRVLTPTGRATCERLREWATDPLALGAYGPTTALVSGAQRTRETYATAFAGTSFVRALVTSDAIYNGRRDVGADELIKALTDVDDGQQSLLLVAHNPSVRDLMVELATPLPDELTSGTFPLAGAYVLAVAEGPLGLARCELVGSFVPSA